ncbi:MAG: (2Fe-2S)-binding protein [Phototrophicales bacterium]|nr:MAG: (2Fe-2S)-binding protein [Phototrophicales bacterium]
MPKITLNNGQQFEVDNNKRLILALRENGVDILHRCGGYAKCTTCRVKIHEGEPEKMTVAEYERLSQSEGLLGDVRLSCQILCTHDMTVEPLFSLANSGMDSPGDLPTEEITPEAIWMDAPKG